MTLDRDSSRRLGLRQRLELEAHHNALIIFNEEVYEQAWASAAAVAAFLIQNPIGVMRNRG